MNYEHDNRIYWTLLRCHQSLNDILLETNELTGELRIALEEIRGMVMQVRLCHGYTSTDFAKKRRERNRARRAERRRARESSSEEKSDAVSVESLLPILELKRQTNKVIDLSDVV